MGGTGAATTSTTSTMSTTSTTATVGSAASTTGTGCAGSIEVCDDGIDNDCDGAVDCADTDCTGPTDGRICVAPAPLGWTLIAFGPGDTCSPGYAKLAKVEEAPTSTDSTCSCACDCAGAKNNPCTNGPLTVHIGMGCSFFNLDLTVTGGCDPIGMPIMSTAQSIKTVPLPVTPVDVPGTAKLPGTLPGAAGTTCTPIADLAGGCSPGDACVPRPASASLCIEHDGDVACPAGAYSQRSVVGAPGAVTDKRSCAACTCSSSAASCSNPTFSAYSNSSCLGGADTAQLVANVCVQANAPFTNDDYFIYSATPTAPTCQIGGAPPAVVGAVEPKSPTTICCMP
jgi:hypothetical protein